MFDFKIGARLVVGDNDSTQFDWVKLMLVPVSIYIFQNAASGILSTYKKARLEMSLVENLIGDIIDGVDDMKLDKIQFQTNLENKYFEKL